MVRKNIERAQALITYRSTRIYRLDYHGFPGSRSAEMVVDVTYHSPGKKEFSIQSEKGSHFLIERVFQRVGASSGLSRPVPPARAGLPVRG